MAKVTAIPATITRFGKSPLNEVKRRRTAAYARVSTDNDDQVTSYEAQIDYYTNYIKNRSDWEFVDVYTDDGISGTSTKRREGFKRMIDDALSGKIDLIVTKSVSRFARNTVDSLSTIRKLKDKGIEVYFEKENIWTFDGKGELLLTIMSSLAQEESRSISLNCTWGQRKRIADGKVSIPFSRFLGYDRGENGELVVNKEQAEVVKRIYAMFLQGKSAHKIASILTEENIPTPGKKAKWSSRTINAILSNEKYIGDALLQKYYTEDFLTKKQVVNKGEIQQYYVEDDHEAIIPRDVFEMVQREKENRGNHHSTLHVFSSKIKCGCCGAYYGSKTWHSTDKYKKVVWRCNNKYDVENKCSTPTLTDEQIQEIFINALNKLIENKSEITTTVKVLIDQLFDTADLEKEMTDMQTELSVVAKLMDRAIYENSRVIQNQEEYRKKFDALIERQNKAKDRIDEIKATLNDKKRRYNAINNYFEMLNSMDGLVTEFDSNCFVTMVDCIKVNSEDDIKVVFKDGTEI